MRDGEGGGRAGGGDGELGWVGGIPHLRGYGVGCGAGTPGRGQAMQVSQEGGPN